MSKSRTGCKPSLQHFLPLGLVLCIGIGAGSPISRAGGQTDQLPNRSAMGSLYESARDDLHRGEYAKARALGERLLVSARQLGDRVQESKALNILGNVAFYTDRDTEALEIFQAALGVARELKDRFGEAVALKDLGITYKRLNRYDDASEMLQQSLSLFRGLKRPRETASALENLGQGYMAVGAFDRAFDMYQQALEIAREEADAQLVFGSLIRMGHLYLELDIPDRAYECLRQALPIAEEEKLSPIDRSWVMMGMSSALESLGRNAEAMALRLRTLTLCRQIGWRLGTAYTYQGMGELWLDRDPSKAAVYFHDALSLLEQVRSEQRWWALALLGRAYHRLGDLDRAVNYYQQAIEHLEAARERLSREDYRASFLGKHERIYTEMIEVLMDRHARHPAGEDHLRAFSILERGKARAVFDRIRRSRSDLGRTPDPELLRRREEINARVARLQQRLLHPKSGEREQQQILRQLSQAEEEYERVNVDARERDRPTAPRPPQPVSAREAQALLDDRTAILTYAGTRDYVLAFVLTARSFEVERLQVTPENLESRAHLFIELVTREPGNAAEEIGRRLYADLLGPVRRHLSPDIQRLVIVPDGALHYLPFETLRPGGSLTGTSKYLLEEFDISYAPSVTVLVELHSATPKAVGRDGTGVLILSNSMSSPNIAEVGQPQRMSQTRLLYESEGLKATPLPYTVDEVAAIARYAGSEGVVYTGPEASERRLKTMPLERFGVIHLASHGLISLRAPMRSALVLAPDEGGAEDGFLQAREIYQLRLGANLVVLSACQTARGRVLAGEGVQGLAGAFLAAGAQSVIASLWNVHDRRTATFMARFYRHLAGGESKVRALRNAKLDLLSDGSTAAPRYWAPFILIGEANHPVPLGGRNRSATATIWLLGALGFSLVTLATLLYFKRLRSRIAPARSNDVRSCEEIDSEYLRR